MALGHLAASASVCTLAALLLFQAPAPRSPDPERLAHHRNLGKAFFENPATQNEAVGEFKAALALAPDSPRDRLNYALALLAAGQFAQGIAELEQVQKQDPKLPHSWFNLGVQYKKRGDYQRAARQFAGMIELVPDEPISHYNLGTLHKIAGRYDAAVREFEIASRLDPNLAAAHFQLFNLYRQLGRADEAKQRLARFQEVKQQQEGAAAPEDVDWSAYSEIYEPIDAVAATSDQAPPANLRFTAATLVPSPATGLSLLDVNADLRPDLLALSPAGARLFLSGSTALHDNALSSVSRATFAAVGDFNNDGYPDVCLIAGGGPVLLVNNKGVFARRPLQTPSGSYRVAVWLDYDHDYDLDLLLLGQSAALLRNQGDAGFADRTADFPFPRANAVSALAFRVVPDSKTTDLAVTYSGRSAVLFRDRLGGKFQVQPLDAISAGARLRQATDADGNGAIDLLYETPGKTFLALNRDGAFSSTETPAPAGALLADVENRGVPDLVAGRRVFRNLGQGRFDSGRPAEGLETGPELVAADFNADGKLDLAGARRLYTNRTSTRYRWLQVALAGDKNLKLAEGAEVEVKAGVRYQKQIYRGVPLHFGLRDYAEADTVRITWPNGLIQSEARQPSSRTHRYKEAQRLSGSCPQVFTWNGSEFVYVTDVLGVAPLGASAGDGTSFPTDSLEHIRIPNGVLRPRDTRYEVRLSEELAEVAYIDEVRLIAVDHPSNAGLFINEKFQSPPYPDLKLYTVTETFRPSVRRDGPGLLELHFPPEVAALQRPLLVLTGWVDWADGSTFLARSQEGRPLLPPKLETLDRDGNWRTLIEDIGLPAGKPKSIVVELPHAATALRISTNVAVHWTGAFLSSDAAAPTRLSAHTPERAALAFRGFSRVSIDPLRRRPEMFFYPKPLPASMWNPTPGFYTRFGDVAPLTEAADDRFVIMGSGDELALSFDAAAFPPVPPGHSRTFLLAVDGWAKDRDPNTAHSQTVEPLPFHRMSVYPYPPQERFPDTAAHRAWQRTYNTRPALRLLRPLTTRAGF